MKNRTAITLILSFIILIFIISPACSLFNNDVAKAKKFMKAGMYPQAIALLTKYINEKPDDADAHFQLGVCYINTGDYSSAEKRFSSAVNIDSDYGSKVGKIYIARADRLLNSGDLSTAKIMYKEGFKFDPILKEATVNKIFELGKAAPERYFPLVTYLDPNLKTKVADYYKSLSDKASGEEQKVDYLKKAAEIDSGKYGVEYNGKAQELGNKYLGMAKEAARWVGKEAEAKRDRNLAIKYLGKDVVDKEFPKVVVYKPGQIVKFNLVKGEMTNHWITFPKDRVTQFDISSKDDKFKLLYDDGEEVPAWTPGNWPANKYVFKIIAVGDHENVTMKVKSE